MALVPFTQADGDRIWINPQHVVAVGPPHTRGGRAQTRIDLVGNKYCMVMESASEVQYLCNR